MTIPHRSLHQTYVGFLLFHHGVVMLHFQMSLHKLSIPHDPSVAQLVTVSVGGITLIPQRENSYEVYLKIADTMLYDAKKFGRNRVIWANEKMEQWFEK